MPIPPKPRRQQPRFDPNRGDTPPEMIELVDPSWILKALGITLAVGIICALSTILWFHHYQARHTCVPSSTQTCPALKPAP